MKTAEKTKTKKLKNKECWNIRKKKQKERPVELAAKATKRGAEECECERNDDGVVQAEEAGQRYGILNLALTLLYTSLMYCMRQHLLRTRFYAYATVSHNFDCLPGSKIDAYATVDTVAPAAPLLPSGPPQVRPESVAEPRVNCRKLVPLHGREICRGAGFCY